MLICPWDSHHSIIFSLMTYMFMMNQRMTKRTDNLKIIDRIVFSVLIFVMNSKNIRNFIISTYFTFFDHSSSYHHFTNSGIFRLKNGFFRFIDARSGTINSFFARAVQKIYTTMLAGMVNIFGISLMNNITTSATKACCSIPVHSNCKRFFACDAIFKDHLCH